MGGGDSSSTQKDVTKIRKETTSKVGDVGLTGENFVKVAQENFDAASNVSQQFAVSAKNLSETLSTGFEALSNTAQSTAQTQATGFEALSNTAQSTAQTQGNIARTQSNIARQEAKRATGDSDDAQNFGGFNVTTTALVLSAVAAGVTIIRSMD